jgi:phosphoribosylcarboxyaminoimidazole (NCAIR) mutase
VAIDGAKNAAYLGIEILAVSDAELSKKLKEAREAGRQKVLEADRKIMAKEADNGKED